MGSAANVVAKFVIGPASGPIPRSRGWARFTPMLRRAPCDAQGQARITARQVYILPTGMGLTLGMVLILMLLGSLNYQNNLGLLFTFLFAGVALVTMHHTWFALLGLRIQARGGAPVFAGQRASFAVNLHNDRAGPRGDLTVWAGGERHTRTYLPGHDSARIQIGLPAARRGWLDLPEVRIDTRYPLGLFRAWCYAHTDARVQVYPRPAPKATELPLAPARQLGPEGGMGQGAGDFIGHRGYRPGDPPRHLDWKALARGRGLVLKQFGGDQAVEVWLDLDQVRAADLEGRLSMLCRQVLDAAEQGMAFGLRLPGLEIPPDEGEDHRHRCLAALATFNLGDHG
jgi:uncharacterized protein (DUF58 family)